MCAYENPQPTGQLGRTISLYEYHSLVCLKRAALHVGAVGAPVPTYAAKKTGPLRRGASFGLRVRSSSRWLGGSRWLGCSLWLGGSP